MGAFGRRSALVAAALAWAGPLTAGPPYQTDDPGPTDLGHWEIYTFATLDGHRGDLDGAAGFDLNYGAVKGLQLTATIPLALARTPEEGWRAGSGDLELGAKYRFLNDEHCGLQAAIFPRVILPTSAHHLGGTRARVLLPMWVQKDFGKTSLFGGGGFEINSGPMNKNFWQAGLAVTRDFSSTLSLGAELTWQSADVRDGRSAVGANIGIIKELGGPLALLLAGGPSFSNGRTSYHSYAALGLNF